MALWYNLLCWHGRFVEYKGQIGMDRSILSTKAPKNVLKGTFLLFVIVFIAIFNGCMLVKPEEYVETRGSLKHEGFFIVPGGDRIVLLQCMEIYDLYSSWNGPRSKAKWYKWNLCQYNLQGQIIATDSIRESNNSGAFAILEAVSDSNAVIQYDDSGSKVICFNFIKKEEVHKNWNRSEYIAGVSQTGKVLCCSYATDSTANITSFTNAIMYDIQSGEKSVEWQIKGGYDLPKGILNGDKSTFLRNDNKRL